MKNLEYITDFGDLNITYDLNDLKSVIRYLKLKRMFDKYFNLRKEKYNAIYNQEYEKATLLRDILIEETEKLNCLLK
jgi:viroplasmin and RNaseH domain-containing protein